MLPYNKIEKCDFRIHDLIDEKYRVERILENTIHEQIFKVIDSEGKEYFLKLLKLWEIEPRLQHAMLIRSESEINSCKIESNYLSNISKNGYVNGNPYVLIDWINTNNLSKLFKSPKLNVISIAKQILFGLHDLHKCGKVHCALTPENIHIIEGRKVLLTNYIILDDRAKSLQNKYKLSINSRFINSYCAYIAPEFYRLQQNATILPVSDIFSFGVVLFQMLTGKFPFGMLNTESDLIQYQGRCMAGDWNKNLIPRSLNRNLWINILDGCLSSSPNDRFSDVDDIIKLMPESDDVYKSKDFTNTNLSSQVQNGILIHQMQGDEYGKKYRLSELFIPRKHIITLGRENDELYNTLPLKEESSNYISRHHCTIEWDEETDTWYIRDGQWEKDDIEPWHRSLNGTYVNSYEVDSEGCKLSIGDIISIGDVKLRVETY